MNSLIPTNPASRFETAIYAETDTVHLGNLFLMFVNIVMIFFLHKRRHFIEKIKFFYLSRVGCWVGIERGPVIQQAGALTPIYATPLTIKRHLYPPPHPPPHCRWLSCGEEPPLQIPTFCTLPFRPPCANRKNKISRLTWIKRNKNGGGLRGEGDQVCIFILAGFVSTIFPTFLTFSRQNCAFFFLWLNSCFLWLTMG